MSVCATYCAYCDVHEACQLMDIFVNTECNVIVSFCVLSLSLCLFTLNLFTFGCSLLCLFFLPSFLPFFPIICPLSPSCSFCLSLFFFFICTSLSVLPVLYFVSPCLGLPFLPLPALHPYLFFSAPPCWAWAQETSGLSPAVGCGRHGEDARAGLEVCVHVPAGVLQGSGDEGPG